MASSQSLESTIASCWGEAAPRWSGVKCGKDLEADPAIPGLEEDLDMENTNKYNILLSIFFVPYVLTAPFLGMLGKIYGPSRVLPCMMFAFGSMTLLTAAAFNWGGLVALRWFLGMAESAFFPLVIYYQTSFYRRGELARRLAIFYAASNIAYACGGLLAFGVFQIEGGAVATWKYLFLLEGMYDQEQDYLQGPSALERM